MNELEQISNIQTTLSSKQEYQYKFALISEYYKDNFYAFVQDVFKSYRGEDFKPHYTVQCLCEHIELNIKGEVEWGIYNLPRGWGKSVIISELASAWALLRDGKERIACYSKKMSEDAKDWHAKALDVMTCDFTRDFIKPNAVDTFNKYVLRTSEGGYRRVASCLSSSVGSDITLAIMDDPQGEDHIVSQAKRNRLHSFFSNGLLRAIRTVDYSVMQNVNNLQLTKNQKEEFELTLQLEKEVKTTTPNTKPRLIVVMQRLFERDFCFYVETMLESMEKAGVHKPHTKLAIPAIHTKPKLYIFPKSKTEYYASEGEFTLASTLTEQSILQAKAQMHPSSFDAQMQQRPSSIEGQLIDVSYFNYYTQETLPNEFMSYAITTDFATTEDAEKADYSVVACWGITSERHIYLLDIERMRGGGLKVDTMFDNLIQKWSKGMNGKIGLHRILIENVTGSQHLRQKFEAKYGSAEKGGLIQKLSRAGKNKFLRFLAIYGVIQQRKVFLPNPQVRIKNKSINVEVQALVDECREFRENANEYANDDLCDNLFDICHYADTLQVRKIGAYSI